MKAIRVGLIVAVASCLWVLASSHPQAKTPKKAIEHCTPLPVTPAPETLVSRPPSLGADLSELRRDAIAPEDKPLAPLLEGLGTLHYKVTTSSERAQTFFNQGLRLVYGFNHLEAIRSFREAARLDPKCAMCYWGESYALGPNINDSITPERETEAYAALQKAIALKPSATETERAFIDALATRYTTAQNPDRQKFDAAFARAMQAVAAKYPNDSEVQTLYVAAVMETRPWEYWKKNDEPQPGIPEALAALESTIKKHPDHPGANHYYIHMVEATSTPDRAVAAADKLERLMPGAGHMVHMPSHIYVRVGRYADAAASNERAILADERYIAQCQAQGLYPVGYYPHNIHFLWSAATMEGRAEVAIDAARKVAAKMPQDMAAHDFVPLQDFLSTPYYALVRFGRWEEMLTEAKPPQALAHMTAMWHYGRGIAFAERGQVERAEGELKAMRALVTHPSLEDAEVAGTKLTSLIELAGKLVEGEIAAKQQRWDDAVRSLKEAVAMQDAQRYNEPPTWHYPVRQSLGAVLMAAGRTKEAETVYMEDLQRNRENGWSLYGLAESLKAQGRTEDAAAAEARFKRAWTRADVSLTASSF